MKIQFPLLFIITISCYTNFVGAQEVEYDDLYFTRKDRVKEKKKAQERKKKLLEEEKQEEEKKSSFYVKDIGKGFSNEDDQYLYWVEDDLSYEHQLNDNYVPLDYTEDWNDVSLAPYGQTNTYHANHHSLYHNTNTEFEGIIYSSILNTIYNQYFYQFPSNNHHYNNTAPSNDNVSKPTRKRRSTPVRRPSYNTVRKPVSSYTSPRSTNSYYRSNSGRSRNSSSRSKSSSSSSDSKSKDSSSSSNSSRRSRR